MAGAKIEISSGTKELLDALNQVIATGQNLRPLMAEISGHLDRSTRERFDAQQAPDGSTWRAVTAETQEQKNAGYMIGGERTSLPIPGKTLHGATLLLRDNIFPFFDDNEAGVASPMEYAAAHQFGTKGMNFAIPAHNRRVSKVFGRVLPFPVWATVPARTATGRLDARPFLGISDEDEAEILAILRDALLS